MSGSGAVIMGAVFLATSFGALAVERTHLTVHGPSHAAAPHEAARLSAASPAIIMLHGRGTTERVFFVRGQDLPQLWRALMTEAPYSPAALEDAAYVDVALFWSGIRWARFVNDRTLLPQLKAHEADTYARFYPPVGERPALLVMLVDPQDALSRSITPRVRYVSDEGLALLRERGVQF